MAFCQNNLNNIQDSNLQYLPGIGSLCLSNISPAHLAQSLIFRTGGRWITEIIEQEHDMILGKVEERSTILLGNRK